MSHLLKFKSFFKKPVANELTDKLQFANYHGSKKPFPVLRMQVNFDKIRALKNQSRPGFYFLQNTESRYSGILIVKMFHVKHLFR